MFMLLVDGTNVRATRWDRSGTIVTEPFDYTEDPLTLRNILWGFALLQEKEQGFDATAVPLEPEDDDYRLMDALGEPCADDISEVEGTIVEKDGPYTFRFVRDAFNRSLAHDHPRYRVTVPAADGPRHYLVAQPGAVARGFSGRGTRAFVAYDMETKRFALLKDTWRPFNDEADTEGDVLRQLKDAGVRNIRTVVCDGQLEHCTVTPRHAVQKAAQAPKNPKEIGKGRLTQDTQKFLRQYRLVMEEFCLPLSTFKNGEELIRVIRDCVQGESAIDLDSC